jgi:hypothetical protein
MYKTDVENYFLKLLNKNKATQEEIATAIGISQPAFWRWGRKTNGLIPKESARDLAEATKGALKYDPSLYAKAA